MGLARVKVVNPGDTILSADWNSEFNNILNNPITLISPTTGAINFQTSVAHTNLTPSAITASSGTGGNALIVSSSGGNPIWGTPAALAGSRVMNLVGTISSQTGTFTADQYLVRTSPGTATFALNSTDSFTINLGTSGPTANGRDVGAAFSSTYIHWYVITTGMGSTAVAGIVSSTPPPAGPALPTSYSAWGYLGASNYTSATTTVGFPHRVRGSKISYESVQNVLTNGASTAVTTVSVPTLVPINAFDMRLNVRHLLPTSAGADGSIRGGYIQFVSGSNFYQSVSRWGINEFTGGVAQVNVPNQSQQFFYFVDTTGAPTLTVDVVGYGVPNGGA